MAPQQLPEVLRQRVQAAVAREGLAAFVTRAGSSERAVLRAVAGLGVRRGTAVLLEAAVEASP